MVVPSVKVPMRSLMPSSSTSATLSVVTLSTSVGTPGVPGVKTSLAGGRFW